MTSKLLTVFLLLALVALVFVNAQKDEPSSAQKDEPSSATNVIDECIKRENCAEDDERCRAFCAGVPAPTKKVANDTQTCYEDCGKEHLPKDEKAYEACTAKCKEDVYQEGVTEPGSSDPAKSQNKGGDQESSGDEGKSDSDSKDGNDSDTDEKDDDKDDSGASLSSKSALVYVFAAALACAAFSAGL